MFTCISTVSTGLLVAALTAFAQAPGGKPPNPKPLSLTGCIAHTDADKYTLNDKKHGLFQLIGKPLDIYIGKRVEVDGTSTATSGLHITTGLYPTPNLAAQAGADPVGAFTASMPGGGSRGIGPSGTSPAPMYTVTSIKPLKGECK